MTEWQRLREEEAEECLARWRAEDEAEEGFNVEPETVTPADIELMSDITKLEEVMTCGDPECVHVDCAVVNQAVKHLIDYAYLRRAVKAHRASKGPGVPVGGWSIADRRLWELVEDGHDEG